MYWIKHKAVLTRKPGFLMNIVDNGKLAEEYNVIIPHVITATCVWMGLCMYVITGMYLKKDNLGLY